MFSGFEKQAKNKKRNYLPLEKILSLYLVW
jgi:hypothetical protein